MKESKQNKSSFVSSQMYTSTDWHDMASVFEQLQQNGKYEIENTETFIATDIYEHIKDLVSAEITVDTIKEIMHGDDAYINTVCKTYEEENTVHLLPDRVEIWGKEHSGLGFQLHFDYFDYTHIVQYQVTEIEPQNVAYMVSEHIVNPGKACDLTERLYHEPFSSLEDAIAYMNEMNANYDHSGRAYHSKSGYKLFVVDKNAILETSWYKDNMLALEYISRLGLNVENYRFYSSAHGVVGELQDRIYQSSTDTEKLVIDKEVYARFRKFLSEEHRNEIDACLNQCMTDSRAIVDRALVLAHIDAKSQEDYNAIHNALADYESRLEHLTRENVMKSKGHDKVCITKDGIIGYFKNAYGINSWVGAKGNPYYGTMFCNMGTVVDILKDYRCHDKFVEELPSQELVDEYDRKYQDWENEQIKTGNPFF